MKALLSLLFLFTLNVGAQTHIDLGQAAHCTPHTKNPLCWEQVSHNPRIPPRFCPASTNIAIILDVTETTGRSAKAKFSCTTQKKQVFDCSGIVDLYGINIIGEEVKITTQFYAVSNPGCHIIGGCQRCVEGISYGHLNN